MAQCAHCGGNFPNYLVRKKNQKYCSRVCKTAAEPPLHTTFYEHTKLTESGCMEWQRHIIKAVGYGQLYDGGGKKNGKRLLAHRYSWTLAYGPIPDGMQVLHKCDNRPCVNPDHLFLGNDNDNRQDQCRKGRAGQKLTPESARSIRDEYAAGGISQRALAAKHGINQETVWAIANNKIWRYV